MAQGRGLDDPYSPEALSLLTLTNLRIRLLKPHHCPASPFTSSRGQRNAPRQTPDLQFLPKVSRGSPQKPAHADPAPYAIFSLLARGTCLCHGHAEQCLPTGGQDSLQTSGVVSKREKARECHDAQNGCKSYLLTLIKELNCSLCTEITPAIWVEVSGKGTGSLTALVRLGGLELISGQEKM